MDRVDIAIIGSGPAGVSAAITSKVRNKNILLFGSSNLSEKLRKAHGIRNYPGLPDISGADLADAFSNHLKALDISIRQEQVTNVYAMGDYFAIQTSAGMYEASTVILAAGIVQGNPLPGEDEYLGRGVSYCATCDAGFYRNKTVAVLGYNEEAQEETEFLADVCEKVYYIPAKGTAEFEKENIVVLEEKPQEILGGLKVNALKTDRQTLPIDGVFILKDAVSPDKLVPGLEMDGPHAAVNLQMETNLPGFFVCGDAAGKPYQYVKAAGQGNIAALSAVSYLAAQKAAQK
ncbi:MAG: NAD(P)/FAD-dependent oxidoreductase [Eubacteriales bacterium]|nr:NAD(P)/FAD-dependent oxidoreductase [Eubacteriales bacterium]